MQNYIIEFQNFIQTIHESWQKIDIKYLEDQKKELAQHRPLPKEALKSLEEKLEVDEVHNSTAIEGNTLTLGETGLVLSKGVTIGGKSLKDHLEVKSYDQAYKYIKSIYNQVKEVDEKLILEIHRLVFVDFTEDLREQIDHGVGIYRKQAVFIKGSSYVPPNYVKIPELMEFFIEYLNSIKGDSLRKAILAHFGIAAIHPFIDGNGRTARLLMNLILLKEGWPIIIVKEKRRSDYLNALESMNPNSGDKEFFNLMSEFLQENFNLYKELY